MAANKASKCLKAALRYAATYGWKIFPANVKRKKSYLSKRFAPDGANWGMTNDPERLKVNFNDPAWRDVCGVGVPTGVENQIFDIENDTLKGHKVDGAVSISALEARNGKLPDTLTGESPSGSTHRIYNRPKVEKVWSSASFIAPGVDVRGDGGMFVAPPSARADGVYRWVKKLPITDAPQWLINLIVVQPSSVPKDEASAPIDLDPYEAFGRKYARREPLDTDDLLDELQYPGNVHAMERDISASMLSRGEQADFVVSYLREQIEARIPESVRWNWNAEIRKIRGLIIGFFVRDPQTLEQQENKPDWLLRDKRIKQLLTEKKTNGAAGPPQTNHTLGNDRPLDLWNKYDPPELPRGLLPKIIEDYAFAQAGLMGSDPVGLAMGALTCCAAAIPDSTQIQVKRYDYGWKESARLWVALVGGVSAIKSPVFREVMRPIARIDLKLAREFAAKMFKYKNLTPTERKTEDEPKHQRLKLEDTTVEGAQAIFRDSPDGLILSRDELAGWFGLMEKYSGRGSSADRGFWLQAWNGGSYTFDRVTRGTGVIENLSANVLGGIQPSVIRKISFDGSDDGLIQRLLPVIMRSGEIGKDVPLSDEADKYDRLIDALYALPKQFFGERKFTDEALVVRERCEARDFRYMKACEKANPMLASHIGKYKGYFARLCLLWHVIENYQDTFPSNVNEDVAQRVEKFMYEFLLHHAIAFYFGVLDVGDDHDRLMAVAGYILANEKTEVSNRDVQRGSNTMRDLKRRDVENVFEQLHSMGWLNYLSPKRAGDPPRWQVVPAVHTLFAERAKRESKERNDVREMLLEMQSQKQTNENRTRNQRQ